MKVSWKVYMLKSLFDNVIFAVDDFLTIENQAPQHQWKKCLDLNEVYFSI